MDRSTKNTKLKATPTAQKVQTALIASNGMNEAAVKAMHWITLDRKID